MLSIGGTSKHRTTCSSPRQPKAHRSSLKASRGTIHHDVFFHCNTSELHYRSSGSTSCRCLSLARTEEAIPRTEAPKPAEQRPWMSVGPFFVPGSATGRRQCAGCSSDGRASNFDAKATNVDDVVRAGSFFSRLKKARLVVRPTSNRVDVHVGRKARMSHRTVRDLRAKLGRMARETHMLPKSLPRFFVVRGGPPRSSNSMYATGTRTT